MKDWGYSYWYTRLYLWTPDESSMGDGFWGWGTQASDDDLRDDTPYGILYSFSFMTILFFEKMVDTKRVLCVYSCLFFVSFFGWIYPAV